MEKAANHFITLFDADYLTRGLAMYESLVNTDEPFQLGIYCMDASCRELLRRLDLPWVTAIPLEEFESAELLAVKNRRNRAEYCWTCTPRVIRHALTAHDLDEVTYIDADVFFFAPFSILLEEFHTAGGSALITKHRYAPRYRRNERRHGTYCVQLVTFRHDELGRRVLARWSEQCLAWCFGRSARGRFGDQKYLDDWPRFFGGGIHILHHLGGGVAPWNVCQYHLGHGPVVNDVPVVFYHFSRLRWYKDGRFDLGAYILPKDAITLFYKPYMASLQKQLNLVRSIDPSFDGGMVAAPRRNFETLERELRHRLKGTHNIVAG